jgi:Na+/H+ antiporter NhaD/arsenite permease-like protein
MLFNIPVEFLLFTATLLGVAVWHERNLQIALAGLFSIVVYKLWSQHFALVPHFTHEAPLILNLFGLLLGFAILAKHFEESGLPDLMPRYLPDDWKGGWILLIAIAVISSFLDNIAAAILGGVVARHVYAGRVSVGYLAAIVAASNAGGAGSIVGDTTTTMMWIAGVPALHVTHAFIASAVAMTVVGIFASRAQQRYQPIRKNPPVSSAINNIESGIPSTVIVTRLVSVALIIGGAAASNILLNFPAAGAWLAILIGAWLHPVPWREARNAFAGAIFLIALVLAASLMPVAALPAASWHTTMGLGFISAVFDNIPLTALALTQNGYDWGLLAFAVGYGGSMIWFGSSAGVAVSSHFPEARNTALWLKQGWFVPVGYVLGYVTLFLLLGWHPAHLPGS